MIDKLLTLHEGFKNKPYTDTVGKLTIGIGRNLTDRGLSNEEILYLFQNDLKQHTAELERAFPWVALLDPVRKAVLIDMAFNLGIPKLSKFVTTLGHVKEGRYEKASETMLQSLWASQVGSRAQRLSKMMKTGEWPVI